MPLELQAIDYTLIIITLLGVIFLAYRFMIYLGKVKSSPGYAKRRANSSLMIAFISLTGIVPIVRDSIMRAMGLETAPYFTEYSFGAFMFLCITVIFVMRSDQNNSTAKQKHTGSEDNVAGDKIGNDKVAGDKFKGDKIEKKEVQGDEIHGDKTVINQVLPDKNSGKYLTSIQRINPEELIGRKKDLKKLHQLLTKKKKVVVVNGMGGIGKTTLAAAYTFQYYDYYQKMVWITQSQKDITNDFVQNQQLIHSLKIDTEGKQADQLFAEILHKLSNIPERPKLLVIDNAFEGLEAHLNQLPSQPEWDLLVTSREAIQGLIPMQLDFLSEDEAIALFQKHCSRITDLDQIRELVNVVELHTLTIEILAKTAEKQRSTPVELQKALETDLRANVKTAHSDKNRVDRITSYLGTIFDFSTLSENETWLLKNFCALPAEFHSYTLLLNLINPEASDRQELFSETLQQLVQKGWLLLDLSGENYRLHRVIGEIILSKREITPEEIASLRDKLIELLALDQTKDNPIDKFIWVPFGQAYLKNSADLDSPETSVLQNNLASALQDLGEYTEAKILMKKAVSSDEKNFGAEHPTTAGRYSNLATVLRDLGEYTEAKILLEKVVSSNEKNFGSEHPSTARSYSNLALVLKDLGEYTEAKVLLEKAVSSDEKNFGPEHPTTAIGYSNLATVLQDLGDYTEAKILLEKAVSSDEKNFGQEHPTTARSYSNLATVLQDLGDYTEAKILLEKAVSSDEKNFGEEHPSTVRSYSNLALVLQDLGEYTEAKILLQKAVSSDEKNFGKEHPTTAGRYSNLAMVLQNLGEFDKAIDLAEKAMNMFLKVLPEDHPRIDQMVGNLEFIKQAAREAGGID